MVECRPQLTVVFFSGPEPSAGSAHTLRLATESGLPTLAVWSANMQHTARVEARNRAEFWLR
jgi:hypothetical protein